MSRPTPPPLDDVDFSSVYASALEFLEFVEGHGTASGRVADLEHFLAEEALKAVFGADFYDYFNSLPEEVDR